MKSRAMTESRQPLVQLKQRIRKRFGTFTAAGRAIGCSDTHLINILSGRRTPSVRLLRRIRDETGLRIGVDAFG